MAISSKRLSTKVRIVAFVLVTMSIALFLLISTGRFSSVQEHVLPDGSTLILTSVSFTGNKTFLHGSQIEKILGDALPTNGIAVSKMKLVRATKEVFSAPNGKSWLIAEFKLTGSNAQSNPFVRPTLSHQFRCLIRGNSGGIDFVQDFGPGQFRRYSDGYFGYVLANRYPRDATWLRLTIESRTTSTAGGPWSPIAEFKIKNKSPAPAPTASSTALITNVSVGELSFVVDGITVVTNARAGDMWNHVVTAKFHAASNGLPMLNWDHPYIRVEDASGNWDYLLASHRSLDPRYVWKLDTDFEPASNFPEGSILRLSLPKAGATITTNLLNLPVAISWDDDFLDASIPTNQANMALRYLSVEDSEGAASLDPSGSWNQFMFRKGSFMWRRNGDLITSGPQPKTLTFAIVTNVHAVFYVQPLLSPGENGK